MCQAVKEMCDDARMEQAFLTAQKMLKDSRFSLEDIANFSGLTLEEVRKLQQNQ